MITNILSFFLVIGVVVFMIYYNSLLAAKSAIELGQINSILGLWVVHFLVILLLILFYKLRQGKIPNYLISLFNKKEKSHA